jgi:hypothetical protein
MQRTTFSTGIRRIVALGAGLAMIVALPAAAQVRSVDPDAAIDGDLNPGQNTPVTPSRELPSTTSSDATDPYAGNGTPVETAPATRSVDSAAEPSRSVDDWNPQTIGAETVTPQGNTYRKDDLIGAAEGVFGKGAQGLASVIEDLLRKQGEPNAYIVGREGSGALGLGVRYGSGTLHHKVEGTKPVYWSGPSIGFDAGLNAANAFVLVYNLYDTEDLFKRFPAGEGQAYFIGGFNISYMRRGDVVIIPVRLGAGVRLGINAGYMKFSHEQKWLPF